VLASSFPEPARLLICWKAASALRKLSPFLPSISPGEKPSRSSSTSVLTISAGSLLPLCGAASLTDSDVKAGVEDDEPCLTCLCVAASAAANGNKAIRKVAIGITLMIRQLCCLLCVPASSSIRTYTARGIDLPGVRYNECAPDCQESVDGKNIEAMEHYTQYVAGVSAR
jgi:hypothetical protein